MDARLVEFAEVLRQNGVRLSPTEVVDAGSALSWVGLEDKQQVRALLQTTLCKRERDLPIFHRLFDFFFSGAAQTFEGLEKSLARALDEQGLLQGDELLMVLATLQKLLQEMSPMAQAALQGDRARLAHIFRSAVLQLDLSRAESPLQAVFFSRRLLQAAGSEKIKTSLDAFEAELTARGLSSEGLEIVSKHLSERFRKVEVAARKEIDHQLKARLKKAEGGFSQKAFHALSKTEIELAQVAVRRLAEKIKSRWASKQRKRRRGALNVRRTLRRNLSWGGVPMVPSFRSKKPQRPEVVVLCDVSDSVRNASRIMLLFMHTLQSLFVRVRSFVFVSDLGEVTEYFKSLEVNEAIELSTAGKVVSLHANSNYGRALAAFARDQLPGISRRTTVLVLGDGRNNFNPAHAWALEDIRRKCKQLLWICTEDRPHWGFGDSEMRAYAKACHKVITVQSLEDLVQIADQLVPT